MTDRKNLREEIAKKVYQFFKEVFLGEETDAEVNDEMKFSEFYSEAFHCLDLYYLVSLIENSFEISFTNPETDELTKVGELIKSTESKLILKGN